MQLMKSGSLDLPPSAETSPAHPLLGLEDTAVLGLSWGRSRAPRDVIVLGEPLRPSGETPQGSLRRGARTICEPSSHQTFLLSFFKWICLAALPTGAVRPEERPVRS